MFNIQVISTATCDACGISERQEQTFSNSADLFLADIEPPDGWWVNESGKRLMCPDCFKTEHPDDVLLA